MKLTQSTVSRCFLFLVWLTVILVWLTVSGNAYATPRFERVALAPITIGVAPISGAPLRGDGNELAQRLSRTATDQVANSLVNLDLARIVERATSTNEGLVVTGSVQLPLSLPPGVIGLRAYERDGTFATAQITFRDAAGQVLASETVALQWNAVRWLRGTHKTRRNRALDDVLQDFVRRGVKNALKQIARRFAAPPPTNPTPVNLPAADQDIVLTLEASRMAWLLRPTAVPGQHFVTVAQVELLVGEHHHEKGVGC